MSFSKKKEYRFDEVTENHNGKRIPLSKRERETRLGPYNYYGAQGVIDFIDDYIFEGVHLLIAEDGANLKTRSQDIARLTKKDEKFWVNNHAHIVTSNHLSDIRYLMYMLNIMDISGYITGSVQPKLNKANLNSVRLELPEVKIQTKIANLLESLDKKIEINNQINKNLEEMAQAIFKHWFVDFEFPNEEGKPYKSSGGEMVESELGLIPKGWEVKALEEVCNEITRGITPKYVEESNLLMLNQKVNKGDLLEKQYYKFFDPEKDIADNKRARKYDILINSLGQGTLGRVHYYLENTENVLVDQHISIVRPIEEIISSSYAYQALKSREYQHRIESSITGSTGMLMLNISKVRGLKILVPDRETNRLFAGKMESIYKNKLAETLQNEVLMDIRDTLLPKLMSGEIRVPLESESDAS